MSSFTPYCVYNMHIFNVYIHIMHIFTHIFIYVYIYMLKTTTTRFDSCSIACNSFVNNFWYATVCDSRFQLGG